MQISSCHSHSNLICNAWSRVIVTSPPLTLFNSSLIAWIDVLTFKVEYFQLINRTNSNESWVLCLFLRRNPNDNWKQLLSLHTEIMNVPGSRYTKIRLFSLFLTIWDSASVRFHKIYSHTIPKKKRCFSKLILYKRPKNIQQYNSVN